MGGFGIFINVFLHEECVGDSKVVWDRNIINKISILWILRKSIENTRNLLKNIIFLLVVENESKFFQNPICERNLSKEKLLYV